MPKGGVEPPLPCGNRILNPARLPVPPLRRGALLLQMRRDIQGLQGSREGRQYSFTSTSEIRELIEREPFRPFRIQLSNGKHYDIHDPLAVAVMRNQLFVTS